MRKIVMILGFIIFGVLSVGCSKSTPKNQAPTAVQLNYPTNNLLCIDNTITFNWGVATDPEGDDIEYQVIVAKDRQMTEVVENSTITATELTLSLEKNTAYYWKVEALDINNNQGTSSEVFAFFTKGEGDLNYVPFTSELLTPENEGQVNAGSINLTWDAADANTTDSLTYELYFGENTTLSLLEDSLTEKSFLVSVQSGKTYSWKVNVKDQKGAKSIGATWSFTVN